MSSRALAIGVVGLGPLVVAAALRLPPVNQLEYADAWFYSAYAWVPRHHFAVFEWNYFSVRFPAVLSIGIFERIFGAQEGYVVLRYLLAVGSGGGLYLGVRRFASGWIALAAVALLYLNPFFSRMLLWDYANFIVVSAGVAGFALWWWADSRPARWAALPGTAVAIAVYANVILLTAVLVLVVVEAVAAARSGRRALLHLAQRVGVAALSAIAVLLVGYVSYLRFSAASPDDLLRPTIDFLVANDENSALYQRPIREWLYHELRIWAPIVTSLALVVVLGRRVLGTDLQARIAQVCIGYTAFLWLYRFTVTSAVLETWWAYNVVVIVTAPALGVLIQAFGREWRSDRFRALMSVAVSGGAALVIRTLAEPMVDLYGSIASRPRLLFSVVAAAAVVVLLARLGPFGLRAAAFGCVLLALSFISWSPSALDGRGTTGVFAVDGDLEWDTYAAGKEFVEVVRDHDSRASRVYTWYPDPSGPDSIGWTTLPHLGTTVHQVGAASAMNRLEPLGRARLLQPDAAYVLALSTRPRDVDDARRALVSAGFRGRTVKRGRLAEGRLNYVLILLTRKPPA